MEQMQRVQKIISNCGYCSRRKAEELIESGRVMVNNKIVSLGNKANPLKDKIYIDGNIISKQKKIYIMLNKPRGYMTTLSDPSNKKNITQLIDLQERVYPIGRLDLYAEGLLLLTNDGDFANRVMHPRYEQPKTYVAKVEPDISKGFVEEINSSKVMIDNRFVKKIVKYIDRNTLEITLYEGRHKIVKRVLKYYGLYVRALIRTKIGRVSLGDLKFGRWRFLRADEINSLANVK